MDDKPKWRVVDTKEFYDIYFKQNRIYSKKYILQRDLMVAIASSIVLRIIQETIFGRNNV